MKYIIEYRVICKDTEVVEAEDEGIALGKGRDLLMERDCGELQIAEELECKIINQY